MSGVLLPLGSFRSPAVRRPCKRGGALALLSTGEHIDRDEATPPADKPAQQIKTHRAWASAINNERGEDRISLKFCGCCIQDGCIVANKGQQRPAPTEVQPCSTPQTFQTMPRSVINTAFLSTPAVSRRRRPEKPTIVSLDNYSGHAKAQRKVHCHLLPAHPPASNKSTKRPQKLRPRGIIIRLPPHPQGFSQCDSTTIELTFRLLRKRLPPARAIFRT